MICCVIVVHTGGRRARTLRVNPSCRAFPGTRWMPGHRSGMARVVVVGEVRRQGHVRAWWGVTGWKRCWRFWCAWMTRCLVVGSNSGESS